MNRKVKSSKWRIINLRPIESGAKSTKEPNGYPSRRWCIRDITEQRWANLAWIIQGKNIWKSIKVIHEWTQCQVQFYYRIYAIITTLPAPSNCELPKLVWANHELRLHSGHHQKLEFWKVQPWYRHLTHFLLES